MNLLIIKKINVSFEYNIISLFYKSNDGSNALHENDVKLNVKNLIESYYIVFVLKT